MISVFEKQIKYGVGVEVVNGVEHEPREEVKDVACGSV